MCLRNQDGKKITNMYKTLLQPAALTFFDLQPFIFEPHLHNEVSTHANLQSQKERKNSKIGEYRVIASPSINMKNWKI